MCFTVAIDLVREELEKTFRASFPRDLPFAPAYYFSAFDHPALPVITSEDPGRVVLSQWGLVPRWVKERTQAEKIRNQTINARSETVTEKPSFRHLAGRQHAVLPVTGFYEWHDHNEKKIPYFLTLRKEKVFSLAGLYDRWVERETGEVWHTFTLLTVPAGPLLARIHNTRKRKPLILSPAGGRKWLEVSRPFPVLMENVGMIPEEQLGYYPLAPALRKRAAERPGDPSLVAPYDYGFDPLSSTLF